MPQSRRQYRVTLADVLEAHHKALQAGGRRGVRDLASIESAIGRAYTGYYRPVHKKAAALVHSLAKNHGFTDGNKRTALLIMDLFLRRSGYHLLTDSEEKLNDEVEKLILDVVENRMDFETLVAWFKDRVTRL